MDRDSLAFFLIFFLLIIIIWLVVEYTMTSPALAVQYNRFIDEKETANKTFVHDLLNPPKVTYA